MGIKAYACYNKDDTIRSKSSSGGIYFCLAAQVIENGGTVFSACYDATMVKHKKIENITQILPSCGSKYLQSDLNNIFAEIESELLNGREVLFVGLPCQCLGLLAYIDNCKQKLELRERLICVDLVCHGISAMKAWNRYLSALNEEGNPLLSVNMRDKTMGWSKYNYSWKLITKTGNTIIQKQSENAFMKGFVSNLYLRPSCGKCSFKGIDRPTDITLGDFWGVWDIQPEMDDNKGTSLVFIHTKKGEEIFGSISDKIVNSPVQIEPAVKYNPSIVTPSHPSFWRETFFRRIIKGGNFMKTVEKLSKRSYLNQAEAKVKVMMKKILRGGVIHNFYNCLQTNLNSHAVGLEAVVQ